MAAGLAVLAVFVQHERRVEDPLVDPRVVGARRQWPIQLASALFGISVLGAQIPLSTFARTDPAVTAYGLGVTASGVSLLVGGYVLALAVGALLLPMVAKRLSTRTSLALGASLVAGGRGLFLVNHTAVTGVALNMIIAGVGSGLLWLLCPRRPPKRPRPPTPARWPG